ncbi:helix-turn-helix domain-containing protein [Longispora albida]|uniref:helix-turn-helix domain-containing protein n=1 Tax=Longispora albida TaxID=203523 RepID=UPI0003607281|nr:helix-turn-helix domain-containing protein [Longispora albida]
MDGDTFGRALRRLRAQRGLSLRQLGSATSFDYTYISHVEHGRQPGSLRLAERCDAALSGNGALISAYRSQERLAARLPAGNVDDWSEMLRRTFLAGTAAAAAGLGALDLPPAPGGPADPEAIAALRRVSAEYRRSYRSVPSSELMPAARAHLGRALAMRPGSRSAAQHAAILSTAGEMASLVAVLLMMDLGWRDQAQPYLDLCWKAARSLDDPELQAVTLGAKSFAVSYGAGRHQDGLEFAELGCEVAATGASWETRAWVAAVASERHASLGDERGCRERLAEARSALEHVPGDDSVWLGLGGFNGDKLLAYEGGDLVRLGKFREAEPLLDAAISRFDESSQRHKCTALLDRAEARFGAGEVDGSCADASAALAMAFQVQHAQNLSRLDTLSQRALATGSAAGRALRREVIAVKADSLDAKARGSES